jgi:hypothetical protein
MSASYAARGRRTGRATLSAAKLFCKRVPVLAAVSASGSGSAGTAAAAAAAAAAYLSPLAGLVQALALAAHRAAGLPAALAR